MNPIEHNLPESESIKHEIQQIEAEQKKPQPVRRIVVDGLLIELRGKRQLIKEKK